MPSVLTVVLLAAGKGERLMPLTEDRPKAAVELGGRTLAERALDTLAAAGAADALVVTGYRADRLAGLPREVARAVAGARVELRLNERWHDANNIVSLWAARDVVSRGCLIVNSDVVFEPEVARRLLAAGGSALLCDDGAPTDAEAMKVLAPNGRVTRISKDAPLDGNRGEYIGLARVAPEHGPRLARILEHFVERGNVGVYYEDALEALAAERPLGVVSVGGLHWAEIDTHTDLARARDEVLPAVEHAGG